MQAGTDLRSDDSFSSTPHKFEADRSHIYDDILTQCPHRVAC